MAAEFLAQSSQATEYIVKAVASIDLNWIGRIIRWLIEGIGIVGIGVIVFTLILKTIVLPLDIYSRYTTKKQSLKMKEMRPQMEKLQKQYANDKNMYNQKVQELQRKNGYNVLGACLPTIVSLVIFLIVFSQFSTYSQYANLESYNDMVNVYNITVSSFELTDDNPDGFLIGNEADGIYDDGMYMSYYVDLGNFAAFYEDTYGEDPFAECGTEDEVLMLAVVDDFVEGLASTAVAEYYQDNNNHFLWVKNIWYPDSMLSREVPSFSDFKSSVSRADLTDYEASYNKVTAGLEAEKSHYNGYFVLIVLAIGFMLLQQWLSSRAAKDANELSTVDGQGARTNKYMMIIMPIIYGIFSFFYSASFSVYMITNTCYSIITTLIINRVMDARFAKRMEREDRDRLSGRGVDKTKAKKVKSRS